MAMELLTVVMSAQRIRTNLWRGRVDVVNPIVILTVMVLLIV